MYAQGRFTFESFLVKDNCVVLWCLRQTEKLTSETREEAQMERRGWKLKKSRRWGERKEKGVKEQRYSTVTNKKFNDFYNNSFQESNKRGSQNPHWFQE